MDDNKLTNIVNRTSSSTFSWPVRSNTNVLCLNCYGTRLIVAGQQTFQLLAIQQTDPSNNANIQEQFTELCDFRNLRATRAILQPTDIGWNPIDEPCFASASTTGFLNIWDANQLIMVEQFKIHNATINRLQFHPTNSKLLLTASQDGCAKLIDFRTFNTNKVVATFRHVSDDGFRDIHINNTNSNLFAAALNDQCIVPLWDIRKIESPAVILTTADRTLCLAWNYNEPYWLATGGRDRTIRIWNVQDSNNRQEPLFKVQSFGTVSKLSWRPTCRYHLACSTLSVDPRIHVWDVRRAYLPQASFCHHQDKVCDFSWRPNSDNIVSVARDERLVHANITSAIKTDQFISLFSLNCTPKGHVCAAIPNANNEYIHALYTEKHIPTHSKSLKLPFSENVMSKFLKFNEIIYGKSVVGVYYSSSADNSVELFHQIARRWTFGCGEKSTKSLANICDINSSVAEQLRRPDLSATWQVIKMIYADYGGPHSNRMRISKNTPSGAKNLASDSVKSHKHSYHHLAPHQQTVGKSKNPEMQHQHQDMTINLEQNGGKIGKLQEQAMPPNSQVEVVDETDTYIVRDVLTDDIIFITPEDTLNSSNNLDVLYDHESEIYLGRDGIPIMSNGMISMANTDIDLNGFPNDRISRQYPEMISDEHQFESADIYDDASDHMQTSTNSLLLDGSEKFFTIAEGYCPTTQHHTLVFDDVIRKTIHYYVEYNELQVAIHLLLALYPILGEEKILKLFNGHHYHWIGLYIELLQQVRLLVKAKQVMKHCIEKEKMPLHYDTSEFDGSIFLSVQAPVFRRLPSVSSVSSINSSVRTASSVTKDFQCSICRLPCRGVFTFCGICFHGGHIDHIRTWFQTHGECPNGCGHRCNDRDTQNRATRGVSQRFTVKS